MKIVRGLEHLSNKERLRELRMQSGEKKALGRPYWLSTSHGAIIEMMGTDCLVTFVVIGQGVMVPS